jgi:hypothetical protein
MAPKTRISATALPADGRCRDFQAFPQVRIRRSISGEGFFSVDVLRFLGRSPCAFLVLLCDVRAIDAAEGAAEALFDEEARPLRC